MVNSFIRAITACSLLMLSNSSAQAAPIEVDEKLPAYTKVGGIAGNLDSIGSDTLNNLMTLWPRGFRNSTRTFGYKSKARVLPQHRQR